MTAPSPWTDIPTADPITAEDEARARRFIGRHCDGDERAAVLEALGLEVRDA